MVDLPRFFVEKADWRTKANEKLTACLKILFERKHLYQSATVDLDIRPKKKDAQAWKLKAAKENWGVHDNATSPSVSGPGYFLEMEVPGVKLFCQECYRVEAFNSISAQEFLKRSRANGKIEVTKDAIQVFIFSFLCQSCKRIPEVFLVRRQGLKLTLCGRAPMEIAEVPPVIPKSVRPYYSGALVAHQSGQTLAGLFLLRTLIEQWVCTQVKNKTRLRADDLLDKYMAMLPKDFNSRFPSMRQLYDNISKDLHDAVGSSDLFDRTLDNITRHFDARRLYEL